MSQSTQWVLGWTIGGVVVVVVVVLLLVLIRSASRAADKADSITEALAAAEVNTAGLWEVHTTNRTIGRITEAATAARGHLAGDGSR